MTPSPDLIHELRASRPVAPAALRARVRDMSRPEPRPERWAGFRARRLGLVAVPAALALALASAGVLGLTRSDVPSAESLRNGGVASAEGQEQLIAPAQDTTTLGGGDRAQRVSATLTVEVAGSDAVSRAAQDALDLTRTLGGHVVSSSVTTGEDAGASIVVRVPVAKVQDAITGLSALGHIVSQQVTIDDLQATLDALERRRASVLSQIARIEARLRAETLDAETRAVLEARVRNLRGELRELRRGIASTNSEARMSTIQLTVVTSATLGGVAVPSRLDRTLDEALNLLVWEGVVALAAAIVVAPFALLALAAWLGRRLYRRRDDERLLATS